jgi:type II secretory pathway component PulF
MSKTNPPPLPPPLPPQPLEYQGPVAPGAGAGPAVAGAAAAAAAARGASVFSIVRFMLASAVMSILLIIFLLIIPRLETVYADFGTKLPWITQLVLNVSRFLRTPLGWVTAAFVTGIVALMIAVLPIRGRWLRLLILFVMALVIIALALSVLLPIVHLMENITSGGKL